MLISFCQSKYDGAGGGGSGASSALSLCQIVTGLFKCRINWTRSVIIHFHKVSGASRRWVVKWRPRLSGTGYLRMFSCDIFNNVEKPWFDFEIIVEGGIWGLQRKYICSYGLFSERVSNTDLSNSRVIRELWIGNVRFEIVTSQNMKKGCDTMYRRFGGTSCLFL
jgi:hypothetical protein